MALGTITINGVEHELEESTPGDLVRFERKFNVPASKAGDEDTARFEWVMYLAFLSARRAEVPGTESNNFDEFLDQVEDVDLENDEDEDESEDAPDPTDAGT